MTWSFDQWIPNFSLFVLLLAPLMVVLIFAVMALARWFRVRGPKRPHTLLELLGYVPLAYLVFPMWDVGEYLLGYREFITERLFVTHFANLMTIIVLVGIAQCIYVVFKGAGTLGLNAGEPEYVTTRRA